VSKLFLIFPQLALILNLETATTACSVALAKDGELLALKEINGDYSHAENLTVFIENVLQQANLTLADVDAIAVSKGPGSYTGLRIGVSAAKGLCYSLNKPLIAIDTLQHLSLSVSSNYLSQCYPEPVEGQHSTFLFCPMIDARRMEVYCAIYDSSLTCVKETAAEIIDEQSFFGVLAKNKIIFFGNGAAKCKSILSKNANAIFIDDVELSAKNMISLSEKAFTKKQFEDVAYFEPYYLKDFVAGKKKADTNPTNEH
jgi:tRNA threonylcarbamoyladenosine biosynthesis protein TsaB